MFVLEAMLEALDEADDKFRRLCGPCGKPAFSPLTPDINKSDNTIHKYITVVLRIRTIIDLRL